MDVGGAPPRSLAADQLPWTLADAQLGLDLRTESGSNAMFVLAQEDGQMKIDQAFGTWNRPEFALRFGLQPLPLGLYAGRLIHDPLLQSEAEYHAPAVLAELRKGPATLILGTASDSNWLDARGSATQVAIVPAVDLVWPDLAKIRLSARSSQALQAVDFASEIHAGKWIVDLEAIASRGELALSEAAGLVGISWVPMESWMASVRLDTRKPISQAGWEHALACGFQKSFAQVAYAGVEWLEHFGSEGLLTLRMGIQADFSTSKYFSN